MSLIDTSIWIASKTILRKLREMVTIAILIVPYQGLVSWITMMSNLEEPKVR
jgi:heme A synthase